MQDQSDQKSWRQTKLFSRLEQLAYPGSSILTTLYTVMPPIEKILSQGGTSSANFTLHDNEHAFRVAEKMVLITPDEVFEKLSDYELTFLLLSAYLHDIGMTPERKKVTSHYDFLLCGDSSGLLEEEVLEFQRWLDQSGRGVVPPLTEERPTSSNLRLAEEIITYYCRHKHNDWSEEYIRKQFSGMTLSGYPEWVDDLVLLCRSHHYGYSELRSESFDPRVLAQPYAAVHLRYLACLLRISDILEFDPERTPDVIFQHRNVTESHAIYWWKDHHVRLLIERPSVRLFATPPTAYIHKAVESMAEDINCELAICRKLADETHFDSCPGLASKLPHTWGLDGQAYTEIAPRHNSYVYIDGAFRPNTKKLLELLSGEELYGSKLVAVREVLQNAFDAVREQIAYERLLQSDPANPELEKTLGDLHIVSLRFEQRDNEFWLVCSDNGVGMTLPIIKDHFLVSGSPRRFDVIELERKCKANNFLLSRTGQFGIGVLSYFLLADQVVLETLRSQQPGDSEPSGWQFRTSGVGSFGELRRSHKKNSGTEVHLHLRSEVLGSDPTKWYRQLHQYVRGILQNIPCRFELTTCLAGCDHFSRSSGWIHTADTFAEKLANQFLDRQNSITTVAAEEFLPATKRLLKERKQKDLDEIRLGIKDSIQWIRAEGKLPDLSGFYRIHIPYFRLAGGNSLAFLDVTRSGNSYILKERASGFVGIPDNYPSIAWKGIHVSLRHTRARGLEDLLQHQLTNSHAMVEIDLHSSEAGMIDVSRHSLSPGKQIRHLVRWIRQKIAEMYESFQNDNQDSLYCFLNSKIGRKDTQWGGRANWIHFRTQRSGKVARWKHIEFPAISSLHAYRFRDLPKVLPRWNDQDVSVVPHLPRMGQGDGNHYSGLPWQALGFAPDRIVELIDPRFGSDLSKDSPRAKIARKLSLRLSFPKVIPLWTREPAAENSLHIVGATAKFPPEWHRVCGVELHDYFGSGQAHLIWNPDNYLIKALDIEGLAWANEVFKDTVNPLRVEQDLLQTKSRAIAWIVHVLSKQNRDLWEWLKETRPDFLEKVWAVVFSDNKNRQKRDLDNVICQWVQDIGDSRLRSLSCKGWNLYTDRSKGKIVRKCMPCPGVEWTVAREEDFPILEKKRR